MRDLQGCRHRLSLEIFIGVGSFASLPLQGIDDDVNGEDVSQLVVYIKRRFTPGISV